MWPHGELRYLPPDDSPISSPTLPETVGICPGHLQSLRPVRPASRARGACHHEVQSFRHVLARLRACLDKPGTDSISKGLFFSVSSISVRMDGARGLPSDIFVIIHTLLNWGVEYDLGLWKGDVIISPFLIEPNTPLKEEVVKIAVTAN